MRRGCIEGSWRWWGVGSAGLRNGDGEGYADHNQSPCSHLSKIQVGTYHPMLKLFLDWRPNPNQELLCKSLHGLALRSLISAGHRLLLSLLSLLLTSGPLHLWFLCLEHSPSHLQLTPTHLYGLSLSTASWSGLPRPPGQVSVLLY